MIRYRALFAWMSLVPCLAGAFSYPALDTTSNWSIQDWGFTTGQGFYFQGTGKRVWNGPGQPETKTVFYNLAVVGTRLGGNSHPLQSQDFMGEMQGDGYLAKYGSFKVAPAVSLVVVVFFMDDGKFDVNAYFTGDGYASGQAWEVIFRVDYDLAGAGNNIAEFLWNAGSEGRSASPPQVPRLEALDGRLVYAPSTGIPSYWAASAHEITLEYPPLPREAGSGVENAGFARILNASNPQFGMVLWGDGATPLDATFKAYGSFDGNLDPKADVSTTLQMTGEAGSFPRYAYAGRDQVMLLKLRPPTAGVTYKFGGKLFQRGGSRPLAVSVHQHHPDGMGGFGFDPDKVIRYTQSGGRTFRNALAELTGPDDLALSRSGEGGVSYLPYDGYAQPGNAVTEAQLHNLMTSQRDYSARSLENVREWRLDLYLVNWRLQGEPDAWEAMFDYGGAGGNGIAREGAAIFWPSIGGDQDARVRRASLSALHTVGLALNMGRNGLGGIMSLADIDKNTVRFNTSSAPGAPFSEVDWYRTAPEAWVKPGRFGVGSIPGTMPNFVPR
jgi:hypothetical protein